jgi:hypothetical protein
MTGHELNHILAAMVTGGVEVAFSQTIGERIR